MSTVSVRYVPDYEEKRLFEAVYSLLDSLGAAADLGPEKRVLVKPNLLSGRKPELAVTTHHAVVAATVCYLRDHGVTRITVADSSGGTYDEAHMRSVYALSGLTRPEIAPFLNHDWSYREVPSHLGASVKSFNLITPVVEADYIISLCKLKTHAMTTMSGAVKNLFGTIPGLQKPDMHCRFPELDGFVAMLCELCETVRPDITLMDAVTAMEGDGPNGGDPVDAGLLMASRDPYALDIAAARFMGLGEVNAPHLRAAKRLGLLPEEVTFTGDAFHPFERPFRLPKAAKSVSFSDSVPKFLEKPFLKVMNTLLKSYPHVDRSKCVGCGKCAESCPQHIIKITDKKAGMPRKGCISCFCCQEMCPVHAIGSRRLLEL